MWGHSHGTNTQGIIMHFHPSLVNVKEVEGIGIFGDRFLGWLSPCTDGPGHLRDTF